MNLLQFRKELNSYENNSSWTFNINFDFYIFRPKREEPTIGIRLIKL